MVDLDLLLINKLCRVIKDCGGICFYQHMHTIHQYTYCYDYFQCSFHSREKDIYWLYMLFAKDYVLFNDSHLGCNIISTKQRTEYLNTIIDMNNIWQRFIWAICSPIIKKKIKVLLNASGLEGEYIDTFNSLAFRRDSRNKIYWKLITLNYGRYCNFRASCIDDIFEVLDLIIGFDIKDRYNFDTLTLLSSFFISGFNVNSHEHNNFLGLQDSLDAIFVYYPLSLKKILTIDKQINLELNQ